jgi:Na+-translocating ferredoxin:NAD+ oxidoreductase RnfD subunit
LAIPVHRLENGAVLLFAFFMISDPKTTPDSRAGRILLALLVAVGAAFVQFKLFRTNGLLWSLVAVSPLVPILNRILRGQAYSWQPARRPIIFPKLPLTQPKGLIHESAVH